VKNKKKKKRRVRVARTAEGRGAREGSWKRRRRRKIKRTGRESGGELWLGSVPQIDHANLFLLRTTHDALAEIFSVYCALRRRIGVGSTANIENVGLSGARGRWMNGDRTLPRMERSEGYRRADAYESNCVTGVR